MRTKPLHFLLIALSFHIFAVHTKLLYYLNPELDPKPPFSFINFNEPTLLAMAFALAYSLATYVVINSTKRKWLILVFAILDSFAMLLYYDTEISLIYGAVFFSVYTGALICSAIFLDKQAYILDHIKEMKALGRTQREIAKDLDISESKVSRTLKGDKRKK